jgi:hypothetical protein
LIRSHLADPDGFCQSFGARSVYMGVRWIVITVTLLAMALPAAAGAQDVPSGNSGIDQYRESIPAVGGNKPTGPKPSGGGNASGTGSVSGSGAASGGGQGSPDATQSLEKLGQEGQGAADVAAATGPNSPQGQGDFASPSPTSGDSDDSGPGMGVVLPIILALALAGALTFAVWRWRRGTPRGAA